MEMWAEYNRIMGIFVEKWTNFLILNKCYFAD